MQNLRKRPHLWQILELLGHSVPVRLGMQIANVKQRQIGSPRVGNQIWVRTPQNRAYRDSGKQKRLRTLAWDRDGFPYNGCASCHINRCGSEPVISGVF